MLSTPDRERLPLRTCAYALVLVALFACGKSAQSGFAAEDAAITGSERDAASSGDVDGGAAPMCSADCSGHARCNADSCVCELGYVGALCDACAEGWHRAADGNSCTQSLCDPDPCQGVGGTCSMVTGSCCNSPCSAGQSECSQGRQRRCLGRENGCFAWDLWASCGSPGCADEQVCAEPVEGLRTEQWGTVAGDQAYAVAIGLEGEALVAGGAGASLEGQVPSGSSDLFLAGRFGAGQVQKNFTRQWGTPAFDYARALVTDGAGAVFVVGDASGKLGTKHEGGSDLVLTKWRADHTPAFTTQWGTLGSDVPQALARDSDGNLLVTGWTDGDLDGENAGALDAFVTKLNADGVVQWSRQWGASADDAGFGITVDSAGNSYVTGAIGGAGKRDIFCRKLSPSGQEQWTVSWGSAADDVGLDLALRSDGDLWVVGWTAGDLEGGGSGGAFVSKVDTESGTAVWTEQLGATADDTASSIALGADGSFYISGATLGEMVAGTYAGDEDVFVQKRNDAGAVLWTKQHGTAGFDRVESSAASTNTLYVVGQTSGSFPGLNNRGKTDNFLLVVAP